MRKWRPPHWSSELERFYVDLTRQISVQPHVFGSLQVVPLQRNHEFCPVCTKEVLKLKDPRYHWNPNNTSCGNKATWWSPRVQAARCNKCVTIIEQESFYRDWRPYRLLLLATFLGKNL